MRSLSSRVCFPLALALLATLALGSAIAQAHVGHEFIKSFNASENPSFPAGFAGPMGAAVDRSSGTVYVSDDQDNVVDAFSEEGVWQSQLTGPAGAPFQGPAPAGLAFDQATEDLYIADPSQPAVDVFSTALDAYLPPIAYAGFSKSREEGAGSVAVDEATGDVLVADSLAQAVDVFGPHGEFLSQWSGAATPSGSFRSGVSVAVDNSAGVSRGEVYVVLDGEAVVDVMKPGPAGEEVYLDRQLTVPAGERKELVGVTVDPGTGEVYVNDSAVHAVYQFSATGTYLDTVTGPPGGSFAWFGGSSEGPGVAVAADGDVYIPDRNNGVVYLFGPDVQLPSVTTGGASGVSSSGAMLAGVVNPEGIPVTSCEFEYGTTTAYGHKVACEQTVGEGSLPVSVSAKAEGLAPDTVYHYRLVAVSEGKEYGQDASFLTPGPPIVESECSEDVLSDAAKLCAQVNPAGFDTSYHFEYLTAAAYAANGKSFSGPDAAVSVPVPNGKLGGGVSAMPASATLTGLAAGAVYDYRIVVQNECEPAVKCVADGPDQTFTTLPPAQVADESFTGVFSQSVTLTAQIDPDGVSSEYRFEYGTSESYGSSTPVAGIPAGTGVVAVQAQVSDTLQPETTYHFRVVVSNATGTVDGQDATFITGSAGGGPPDGRRYEMVSPVANADGDVYEPFLGDSLFPGSLRSCSILNGCSTLLPFQAAANGDAMAYVGSPSVEGGDGAQGTKRGDEYLAVRAAGGGWTASNIAPAAATYAQVGEYQAFSSDLSVGIFDLNAAAPLVAGAPGEGYNVLYARSSSNGGYHPLFTATPPNRPAVGENGLLENAFEAHGIFTSSPNLHTLSFAGANAGTAATPAFGHLLFEANDDLLEGEGKLEKQLSADIEQEVDEQSALGAEAHKLTAEGGTQAQKEALEKELLGATKNTNYLYASVEGRLQLVNVLPDGEPAPNASFGSPPYDGQGEHGTLENSPPDFDRVISADGSRIFWSALESEIGGDVPGREISERPKALYMRENGTETVEIAQEAQFQTANSEGTEVFFTKGDLYAYDVQTQATSDLSEGVGVQSVIEAGENGEYVYYVDDNDNLSVVHDNGKEWEKPKVIAKLAPEDDMLAGMEPDTQGNADGDWRSGFGMRTARVTPDGRQLVFMSVRSLTGYDVTDTCGDILTGACPEVYVYDAEANGGKGGLSCASCAPSGEPGSSGYLQPSYSNTYVPRWISANGNRVFFDSPTALVPRDTNGTLDVYEWEREGEGGCVHGSPYDGGGCVYLISSGKSPGFSLFADADATGENVFFVTRSRLVPEDPSEAFALYDARAGAPEPLAPPACSGAGCQGVPPAPPIFATPASVTFNGVGNYPAPAPQGPSKRTTKKTTTTKCAKGKKRVHGRCTRDGLRGEGQKQAKKTDNHRRTAR
jgi:hypothetical protein